MPPGSVSNIRTWKSPPPRPAPGDYRRASGDWTKDTLTVKGPAIQHIYQLLDAPD